MIVGYGLPGNNIGATEDGDNMLLFFTRPHFEFCDSTPDFTIHFLFEMIVIEANGGSQRVPYHHPVGVTGLFKDVFLAYLKTLSGNLEETTS